VRPQTIIIYNKIKPKVTNSTRVYDIRKLTKNAQVRNIKEVRSSVGIVLMKDLSLFIVKSACDWEADTDIGKGYKSVLVTLAERCSRKTLIAHINSKHAEVVGNAIIRLLKDEEKNLHTITFDNGKRVCSSCKDKKCLSM
jgi:IS30 family transposase